MFNYIRKMIYEHSLWSKHLLYLMFTLDVIFVLQDLMNIALHSRPHPFSLLLTLYFSLMIYVDGKAIIEKNK